MEKSVLVTGRVTSGRVVSARQDRGQLHPFLGEGVIRQNALVGEETDHRHIIDPTPDEPVKLGPIPRNLSLPTLEFVVGKFSATGAEPLQFPRCLLALLDEARSLSGSRVKRGPDSPADRFLIRSDQVAANPVREVRSRLNLLWES